jgi:hypothetical protein
MKVLPELASGLARAAELSPTWARLIANWDDLIELLREEYTSGSFPRTAYAMVSALEGREPLLAGFVAPAPRRKSRGATRPFYIDCREVNRRVAGLSIDAAVHGFKAITVQFSSPCVECGMKRDVFMDSVYGPTPDHDRCDPCARKHTPLVIP